MIARPLVLAVTGVLTLVGQAEPAVPVGPPETLPAAIERQLNDVAQLQKKTDDAAAALRKWYDSSLDALKKDALGKGDLDRVLAVDAERERMSRDLTEEEKAKLPPASLSVRNQFDQARVNQAAQQKTASLTELRAYLTSLEALEKRLTQKGDLEGAIATRKERSAAADLLSKATPLPGEVLAAQPPKPVVPMPAATPAPATPAPIARVLPGDVKPGAVLQVASELKAKANIVGPAPEALAFEAPNGDGRRGARGVLIKNEADTGKNGSTWTFNYARGGSAQILQIVHPHGRGQAVISVRATGVGIGTPSDWNQAKWGIGWSPEEIKRVKMTKEAKSVFPLKDDQSYTLESALSPTGSYTLTIDGKVVCTAHVTAAPSLGLGDGFKGPDLPMKWSAGYAGLIVGPLDSGINVCRNLKFQASAPEPRR